VRLTAYTGLYNKIRSACVPIELRCMAALQEAWLQDRAYLDSVLGNESTDQSTKLSTTSVIVAVG
jgi:hypothetical protein